MPHDYNKRGPNFSQQHEQGSVWMDHVDPEGGSDRYSQRSRTDTEDRSMSRTITIIFPGPEGLKPSMKKPAKMRPTLNRSLIRM